MWAVLRASAHPRRPLVLFYRIAFLPATVVFGSSLELLRNFHSTAIAWFTDMELLFWRRGRLCSATLAVVRGDVEAYRWDDLRPNCCTAGIHSGC